MSYIKQGFTSGQTLKAAHLNYIEDGIATPPSWDELEDKPFGKKQVVEAMLHSESSVKHGYSINSALSDSYVGKTAIVEYDGAPYECVVQTDGIYNYISGDGEGYHFYIGGYPGELATVNYSSYTEEHTLCVYIVGEEIVPLPAEYLPSHEHPLPEGYPYEGYQVIFEVTGLELTVDVHSQYPGIPEGKVICTYIDESGVEVLPEIGQKARVTVDGVEYVCEMVDAGGFGVATGCYEYIGVTEEMPVCVDFRGTCAYFSMYYGEIGSTHDVRVELLDIHPLDEKFLPESVARVEAYDLDVTIECVPVEDEGSTALSITETRSSNSFATVADKLKNGESLRTNIVAKLKRWDEDSLSLIGDPSVWNVAATPVYVPIGYYSVYDSSAEEYVPTSTEEIHFYFDVAEGVAQPYENRKYIKWLPDGTMTLMSVGEE